MENDRSEWRWRLGDPPPILKDHSKAKLALLGGYLQEYLRIVGGTARRWGHLELTVVDAFCGGGAFREEARKEDEIAGSPLVLLDAAEAARKRLLDDAGPSTMTCDLRFIFNDIDADHIAYLKEVLKKEGYVIDGQTITTLTGTFETNLDRMIGLTQEASPRAGRSIWILDQTGWSAATLGSIARILTELPKSEVILTLARDHLIRLATNNPTQKDALREMGLSEEVLREISEIGEGKGAGAVGQRLLMDEIIRGTNAAEHSAFVLEPTGSNRAILLVHLANHERARDAMLEVQWALNGVVYHFAGEECEVLSYRGLREGDPNPLDLKFNETERDMVREKIGLELAEKIRAHPGGMQVNDVLTWYRNRTLLPERDIITALAEEAGRGNLEMYNDKLRLVNTRDAGRRRNLDGYRLAAPRQIKLFG